MKKIKITLVALAFGISGAVAVSAYASDLDRCIATNCVQGPYNFAWCVQQCRNGGF